MPEKSLAVVILNWNGSEYLQKFLPPLIERTTLPGVEIVVADNGSTDNSVNLLKNDFPSVRLITLDKNYGFASGYNKALSRIDSDYFVLLNSDVEVARDWLQPMLQYMNEHSDTAACQPKIRSYSRRNCFEHAGAAGGFIDRFAYPFCRGRIFATVERDNGQYDSVADIFWATGACLFIRAGDFRAAGGFDDDFFAHMEEIDLCWRLKNRGKKIACIPESVVYHVGGGTLDMENPRKTYLNFRNSLLLLYKNLPEKQLKKTLVVRCLLDYMAALQFAASGKLQNAKSILKARRDYKQMRRNFIEKRKENLKNTTSGAYSQLFPKSIVFQYYLRKKKYYTELF
jgi:GT2 family glycosyltransferase